MSDDQLTHFNKQQRAQMVDVSGKNITTRVAVAMSQVEMESATLQRIKEGQVSKGDVLAVAQVAGIMAAKKTAEIIPMCHPIPLSGIDIRFEYSSPTTISIEAQVKTTGVTGVEMEALTAASVAALTIYDMCKAMDKAMSIGTTCLVSKVGGKSGDYTRETPGVRGDSR
jgi:cyclic pyranopterin phosphate synthase